MPVNLNAEQTAALEHAADPSLLAALTGQDATGERALALRTRRAVYTAVAAQRTERKQERRSLLLALLLTGALTLTLAPALWAGMDAMLGGESLLDLPGMFIVLGISLFAAVVSVLFLVGGERSTERLRGRR